MLIMTSGVELPCLLPASSLTLQTAISDRTSISQGHKTWGSLLLVDPKEIDSVIS